MSRHSLVTLILTAGLLILAGALYMQTRTTNELRKDVNRVSVIQVRCAGNTEFGTYGNCVAAQLVIWAEEQRDNG